MEPRLSSRFYTRVLTRLVYESNVELTFPILTLAVSWTRMVLVKTPRFLGGHVQAKIRSLLFTIA